MQAFARTRAPPKSRARARTIALHATVQAECADRYERSAIVGAFALVQVLRFSRLPNAAAGAIYADRGNVNIIGTDVCKRQDTASPRLSLSPLR
jgi:hypothetical protein